MKTRALLTTLAAALLIGVSARAQTITNTEDYAVNIAIPDNDLNGISDTHTLSTSIYSITEVELTLDIAGGYNGDLYAYLSHGGILTVLLNRPGRTVSNDYGYADSGVNVTFSDAAANGDIHEYQSVTDPAGGPLVGTWQPDGRAVSPAISLDTTPRTLGLGDFFGADANGDWTLFVADASPAGTATLLHWQLIVRGLPEPSSGALLALAGGALCFQTMRRRRAPARHVG